MGKTEKKVGTNIPIILKQTNKNARLDLGGKKANKYILLMRNIPSMRTQKS